ncbi:MAG TPA: hypothetical protein VME46_25315 [Acidimicrobiales bacterium]|nr:hypothetical protein [Acidimicrobiales bacterium]
MSEQLVASRGVMVNRQQLDVRISQHPDERFWRVDVRHPAGSATTGTTLDDDNFLCRLILSAVAGEGYAWESLAHWGHRRINHSIW